VYKMVLQCLNVVGRLLYSCSAIICVYVPYSYAVHMRKSAHPFPYFILKAWKRLFPLLYTKPLPFEMQVIGSHIHISTNCLMCKVGQNRICTPYMTVCKVISLLKSPYIRMYVWFWPTLLMCPFFLISSTQPPTPAKMKKASKAPLF
jgi:hypothetical protein